ncbi:MAG: M48 family metalloprotease [Candidatus Yanofskybacteria bacterium]|nr:M48 family metalloprotease [Candidatus Yanofskybacteria bacterium]
MILCIALAVALMARGSRWIPCAGMWIGYHPAFSLPQKHLLLGKLWLHGPDNVPAVFVEPASPRILRAYRVVVERAGEWGFLVVPQRVLQTSELVPECLGCPDRDTYAVYSPGAEAILFDQVWVRRMTDRELLILTAHEIGHVVDRHTGRTTHWAFREVQGYTSEAFADFVARLLVSPEEVTEFNEKYSMQVTRLRGEPAKPFLFRVSSV